MAPPSPWLLRFAHLFRPGGSVLDVAAGSGRNSRWLSDAKFRVTAVDRDRAALASSGAAVAVCADLETGEKVLEGQTFDAVVVMNYLHRALFPTLKEWLAPAGVLVYETFAVGQEAYGRPTNRDFLLQRGELLNAFSELTIVAFEEGIALDGGTRAVQRLCATRNPGLSSLP
jgi:SAM-dependent methyltransferase